MPADSTRGEWQPLPIADVIRLFAGASIRWWIGGGHALDLHLGRSWRAHDDVDVGFSRDDAACVRDLLAGWDVHIAANSLLRPWTGAALSAELRENNLWCRRAPDAPWCLDLTVSEGDTTAWVFRRDPRLRVAWERAVLTDQHGVPYLAPELQLLFKSSTPRVKDDLDAAEVIPQLDTRARGVLRAHLPADHRWLTLLRADQF